MQDITTTETAPLGQSPYWASPAAYELAEALDKWEREPNDKIYLAAAYQVDDANGYWYIKYEIPKNTPLTEFGPLSDLHDFEADDAGTLVTQIAAHFGVGIHCFDGRNFNVTVTSFRLSDLLPLVPTIATQLRRKLLLLIDNEAEQSEPSKSAC